MTIEFARLWAFALVPLPLVAWLVLPALAARGALQIPSSLWHTLTKIAGDPSKYRLNIPHALILRLLGWIALVVALAGPQVRSQTLQEPSGRDLVVALDLSASMAEPVASDGGGRTRRIDVVNEVLARFVIGRRGDRIGLIAFAREADLIAPMTFDTGAVAMMLEEVAIGLPGRRTDIGQAIGLTIQLLRKEPLGERVLIVVSDGETNVGELAALDASAIAAQETHNEAIVVHLCKPNCLSSKEASPTKISLTRHLISPLRRTRRTWWVGVVPGLVQVFGKATG